MSSSQILPIAMIGEPILNRVAVKVSQFDASLTQLAENMLTTMQAANGVGIFDHIEGITLIERLAQQQQVNPA